MDDVRRQVNEVMGSRNVSSLLRPFSVCFAFVEM